MPEIGWNRPPPPGFQGLRPDMPIEVYVRNLPHWRQDGATYFVTYRLGDSLPESRLHELRAFKAEWERRHRPPYSEAALQQWARESMERMEGWLDEGHGSCLLRDLHCATHVVDALQHFEGDRHETGCFVVMPNHVHLVVRPLQPKVYPLESILQSCKRHASREINQQLGRRGTLWQEESFDRILRDEEHLYRAIQYIGRNPSKARLKDGEYVLWMNPEWEKRGWGFER